MTHVEERRPSPVTSALDALRPISLEEVTRTSELQRRFDAKHLVPQADVDRLLDVLGERLRVLEVDERRVHRYETMYFDTPRLELYRAHLQGRRRRYKVRVRHYGDPASAMLEVKVKERGGRTAKHRVRHPGPRADVLDDAALRFVADALDTAYGLAPVAPLSPSARIAFRRITLADPDLGERITIDATLVAEVASDRIELLGEHAVVECKAERERSPAMRALLGLGHRPVPVSKYCLAVAASGHDVPGNPWLPVLRRLGAA